jgi:predicted ATPase
LTQDLQLRGQCEEVPLELLSAAAVGKYLSVTFPAHRLPDTLARVLHRRTSGNPLFLVNVVQDWITQGMLAEAYGTLGQVGQGLDLLAEALTTGSSSGERWWEAEVYRLKGELMLQQTTRQS